MSFVILKIVLCSSLLFSIYFLFLRKEKMYHFNRFFLIFSLIFSYAAPFISVTTTLPNPKTEPQLIFEKATQEIMIPSVKQETFDWISFAWVVYGIVTLILLIKTIISIITIKNLNGKKLNYQNYNILLTKEHLSPFSFWNTIYLGETYWMDNKIDPRILLHEKSHLDEKHSLDIILAEFFKIFTWFNPAIYFYKKAMITNHEFLADAAVLKGNFNVKEYQKLILQEIILKQKYNLTHSFNFNNTKKRFIMMTTKKSKLTGLKKIVSIPILIGILGLFVQKTYANSTKENAKHIQKNSTNSETPLATKSEKNNSEISDDKENLEKEIKVPQSINKEILLAIQQDKKDSEINEKNVFKDKETNVSSLSEIIDSTTAEYPGGSQQLRTKMLGFFDISKINSPSKEMYKSEINFAVDESGKVTNVRVDGNNDTFNDEAKSSFLKANEGVTWKPATKDGKIIASHMKIPLTMSF